MDMIKYKYFQFLFLIALIGSPNIIFSQDLGNGLVSALKSDKTKGRAADSLGIKNDAVISANRQQSAESNIVTSHSDTIIRAFSQTSSLSIGNPANGLDLTDQILKLSLAGSSTTGALSASDWLRFSQHDNYGSWLFQAGNNSVAPIESHNRIFLKEGSGISIKDSSYTGGQYRDVTLSLDGEAMEGDGNNYPNSLQFNYSTGNLTIGIEGLEDDLICKLDGRYLQINNPILLDSLLGVEIAGAQNGDVLKYINGTWQFSSDLVGEPGTGDNWGTQLVVTDSTISGDGTNSQLSLSQQNALDGQVLKWNNALNRWAPARDSSGTENQDVVADNITLSGSGSELNPLMLAPQDANPGEVLKWNDALNRWAPASDIGAEVSNSVWKSNGNNIYYTLGSVNIGHGDTTQNLYVNGKIYAKEVIVQTSISQPDYVFEKDYPLMSLSDLKIFTEKHKHLPEIPSAKEVKENGVDLAKMNMLILQKVEELTLYTIDHHKRLSALEKIAGMSLLNQ